MSLPTFLSLLERQEQGKASFDELVGLLSLYTLANIVDYLQRNTAQQARPAGDSLLAKATDPTVQKALAAVLENPGAESGQALTTLARSLGKNPATILNLVNMLAAEKKEVKAHTR